MLSIYKSGFRCRNLLRTTLTITQCEIFESVFSFRDMMHTLTSPPSGWTSIVRVGKHDLSGFGQLTWFSMHDLRHWNISWETSGPETDIQSTLMFVN